LISITNNRFIYFCSALFVVAAACSAYLQEIYFLAIPPILIIAFLLVQHPHHLFYLLMLTIPWSREFNFMPSLGTDLPDEPLMLLGNLTIISWMIYQRNSVRFKKIHPLIAIILLQLLWTIITVTASTDFILSAKYSLAKGWYLLAFVALPVFLFQDEKVFRKSILLLLCSMLTVMAVILVRHGINGWTFEKVNDSVRPFFRNHVNYSALLIFMAPLQIAIIKLSSGKIRRSFFFILAITIIAIYFSYARGAWLALIAGLISYWLLRKQLLVFSFLFFISLIIVSVFWIASNDRLEKLSNDYKTTIFHHDFKEHLIATYQLKDLSNAERIYRWVAGVRMVKDNWETGFGPSTFYHRYKSYTLPAFKTYVSENRERSTVHNYFLLILIEQGVPGFLLFIVLVAALFWYAQKIYFRAKEKFWKAVVAAVASILTMQCIINFLSDMIETDKVGSVFYLCVATLITADLKTRKRQSDLSTNVKRIS